MFLLTHFHWSLCHQAILSLAQTPHCSQNHLPKADHFIQPKIYSRLLEGYTRPFTAWPCSGHAFPFWLYSTPSSLQFGENSCYDITERQFSASLCRSLRVEILPALSVARAQGPSCRYVYIWEREKHIYIKKIYTNVHISIIHDGPKVEMTQMSTN